MTPASDKRKGILLVLDDEPHIRRMLARFLAPHVTEVLTAATPEEAADILAVRPVTHLIVDYHLGEGTPPGDFLLGEWRGKYPAIQKTMLFTGTDISRHLRNPAVDVVATKAADPYVLLALLGLQATGPPTVRE